MKNMNTVMRIARSIRCSAERFHVKTYNMKPGQPDLTGWCAVTTNILFVELARRGIRSQIMWNGSHCFLIYGRYLIDITATQFNKKHSKVVKKLRSKTQAIGYWKEQYSESTMGGRERNRGWGAGPGIFQQPWQDKTRAHLRTLK